MNHPLLATQNLCVHAGKKTICHAFNWQIQPGEIWGLAGPNGCGKTTLLHTFAGLHRVKQGSIYLQGKNIASLSSRQMAKKRGILFQHTHTAFPQTVHEFCLASRHPHQGFFARENPEDHAIVQQALVTMALEDKLLQNVETLSGGELRRLSIATLLAQNPEIYLLDEPFNHLDLKHQWHTLQVLQQLATKQHAGIVIVLHDLQLLRKICSHVLLPAGDGKIIAGSVDCLNAELLSEIYACPILENDVGEFDLASTSYPR